jgi:hypothetical protein
MFRILHSSPQLSENTSRNNGSPLVHEVVLRLGQRVDNPTGVHILKWEIVFGATATLTQASPAAQAKTHAASALGSIPFH